MQPKQKFHCPTKDKTVIVTQTLINATAREDLKPVFIPGKIECSDNDYHCTNKNCPLIQST